MKRTAKEASQKRHLNSILMPPTLQRYTNNSNYACFSYKSHLLSFQLNDVTAPSEVITSPPSVSQGDFGDDETASIRSGLTFRTNSTFKTFATGFTNCSNLSFSKLFRGFSPTSALHKEMVAVLAGNIAFVPFN